MVQLRGTLYLMVALKDLQEPQEPQDRLELQDLQGQ